MPKGDANRKLTDEQCAGIVRLYTTPQPDGTWLGCKVIAEMFGVAAPTILYRLRAAGVELRDARESHAHGKRCKPIKNLPPEGSSPPACKCGCGGSVGWNQRKNRWNAYVTGHYRPDALFKSREWLHEQYVTLGRTSDEIAAMVGVNGGTILRYLHANGIPLRDHSASRVGRKAREKNPAWKGGITPERQRLYKAGNWRNLVKEIYARDNYHCQRCGSPKTHRKGLHAHHIKPWADNVALRFDAANLITLCRKCHTWVHSLENTSREYLE